MRSEGNRQDGFYMILKFQGFPYAVGRGSVANVRTELRTAGGHSESVTQRRRGAEESNLTREKSLDCRANPASPRED